MTSGERAFLVTWKRDRAGDFAPDDTIVRDVLSNSRAGCWNVLAYPHRTSSAVHNRVDHDQFLSDCLRHIPPAFWTGESREETILTYLSAVDDAMGLIAENIAARIIKEVK